MNGVDTEARTSAVVRDEADACARPSTLQTRAAADAPANGCATGNRSGGVLQGILYLAVANLAPLGYRLPGMLDNPDQRRKRRHYASGTPSRQVVEPSMV